MIWSDMYFRLRSKTKDYYDEEFSSPENIIDKIPDVELVFWDYTHTKEATYERLFNEHFKLRKDVSFAGGIWSWCGHLVSPDFAIKTSVPALQAAVKTGIKSVTATMWGDNGNECNHFQCISLLPVFSEFCYKGEGCCVSDIISMSEFITGSSWDVVSAMSCFSEYIESTHSRNYIGKNILYTDILLNLITTQTPLSEIKDRFVSALNIFKNNQTFKFSPFAAQLLKVDIKK